MDLQEPLVNTIHKLADECSDHEITAAEFKTMKKVVRVLKPFEEATRELSKHDASISMAIPNVTSLIEDMEEETSDDEGVLTMKRALKDAMEWRFENMEENKRYTISTMLDSRYKHNFYRDPEAFDRTKTLIVNELISDMRGPDNCPSQVS